MSYIKARHIDLFGYRILFTRDLLIIKIPSDNHVVYFIESFTGNDNKFIWPILPAPECGERFIREIKARHDYIASWVWKHRIDLNKVDLRKFHKKNRIFNH